MQRFIIALFQKLSWSVNSKITACFVLLVLLSTVSSCLILISILHLESNTDEKQQKSLEQADARAFSEQVQNQINAYSDAIYLTQQKVINSSYSLQPEDSLTRLRADDPSEVLDKTSTLARLENGYQELSKIFNQLNKLLLAGDIAQADRIWANNLNLRNFVISSADQFKQELDEEAQIITQSSSFTSTITKTTAIVAGVLGVLFAVFFAWLISKSIGRPLAATRTYLNSISEGDLSKNLHLDNKDELGDLAKALNLSVKTLRGVLESFNIGSQMEEAAINLDLISNQQHVHATSQVLYIDQINVAMYELNSTAKSISDNAAEVATAAQTTFEQVQQVNNTTDDVSRIVQQLKQVVSETGSSIEKANTEFSHIIEQMNEVDEQSQSIEGIIRIITEIASETHLLALNAAIEAAGAGESGVRFAIVAKQVKELATRSSKTIEEVKALISNARRGIRNTRQDAEQRLGSMDNVVNLGVKVSQVVEEVLERVESNQRAANAILTAAEKSTFQATQIKSAAFEQQVANQQILATISNITEVVNKGAKDSSEVKVTSAQLNAISRSLTSRLAELKFSVAATPSQ